MDKTNRSSLKIFVRNLRILIRNGYPKGLPLHQLEPAYTSKHPNLPFPTPDSIIPDCWSWLDVFAECDELKEWFYINGKYEIRVVPKPEPDLHVFCRLNSDDNYKFVRNLAKLEGCPYVSDSDPDQRDCDQVGQQDVAGSPRSTSSIANEAVAANDGQVDRDTETPMLLWVRRMEELQELEGEVDDSSEAANGTAPKPVPVDGNSVPVPIPEQQNIPDEGPAQVGGSIPTPNNSDGTPLPSPPKIAGVADNNSTLGVPHSSDREKTSTSTRRLTRRQLDELQHQHVPRNPDTIPSLLSLSFSKSKRRGHRRRHRTGLLPTPRHPQARPNYNGNVGDGGEVHDMEGMGMDPPFQQAGPTVPGAADVESARCQIRQFFQPRSCGLCGVERLDNEESARLHYLGLEHEARLEGLLRDLETNFGVTSLSLEQFYYTGYYIGDHQDQHQVPSSCPQEPQSFPMQNLIQVQPQAQAGPSWLVHPPIHSTLDQANFAPWLYI